MMLTNRGAGDLLPRNPLGRAGFDVPGIALGGAGLGDDRITDKDAVETVEYAFAQGIDYLDTSPLYGESERRIGLALQGVPRDSYHLSTKTGTHPLRRGDYSRDGTLWSIENSLKLLGVDYMDLLLIHDPHDIAPALAPGGALDTLEELKAQGIVRSIGLGQRRHDWHRQAIETGRFDVILTFNDYHPLRTTALDDGLLDLAKANNVGVLNGSALMFGLLAGRDSDVPDWVQGIRNSREGKLLDTYFDLCDHFNISPIAVALQFCLRQPRIAATLTGAKTRAELEANLKAATAPLPDGFWQALKTRHFTEAHP